MNTKCELREIINFQPVLLYKDDLLELEKLILDSNTHTSDSTIFTLSYKEKKFTASTVNELLKFEALPESSDKLSISRIGWIKQDGQDIINRGIDITMYHNYIQCQIHAFDEDWYKGKLSRLKTFFKNRKPWYAFLTKISFLFPTFALACIFYSILLFKNGNFLLFVAPLLLFVILSVASFLSFTQKIFPFVHIVLKDKNKISFGFNTFQNILIVITSILTIFQIIYTFIR